MQLFKVTFKDKTTTPVYADDYELIGDVHVFHIANLSPLTGKCVLAGIVKSVDKIEENQPEWKPYII